MSTKKHSKRDEDDDEEEEEESESEGSFGSEDDSDDDSDDSGSDDDSGSGEESGSDEGEDEPKSSLGKRASDGKDQTKAKRRQGDDEEKVKIVDEDFDAIDKSNIIPRAKRGAALASGLARKSMPPSNSRDLPPASSSSSGGRLIKKSQAKDEDSDEAEF